ncbi:MAG: hypothetical protein F6K58_19940 [Symploca sp. SIO2E9]|nr:hypothetical protein [Symploca sp. SIO2E9]
MWRRSDKFGASTRNQCLLAEPSRQSANAEGQTQKVAIAVEAVCLVQLQAIA